MSIKSSDPKAIVFLQSASKRSCAKRFELVNGEVRVRSYDEEFRWNAVVERAEDIHSLAETLTEVANRGDMIAIVGELIDDASSTNIARKMYGDGASIRPSTRQWLVVDVDNAQAGDASEDMLDRVKRVWRELLPDELCGVSCWYQFTSSAGMTADASAVKVRYWFWLGTPVSTETLRQWAKRHHHIADPSVFVACQPIYIANPKFSGMRDPLPGIRCGLLEGAEDAVNTEAMSLEDAEKDAERHRKVGDVVQRKDVEPCEAQIDSTLAKIRDQVTTDARHFHAMGVIAELYALGCDIPRIHEAAEDVFVRQGRDPRAGEIAEMISYIVRKDQAGALTTRNSPLSQILPDIWASQEEPHPGPGDSGGDVLDDAGHALLSTRHPDGVNAMTYLKHRHVDGGFIRWAEQDWEWDGVCWRRLENKETLKHRIDKLGGASLSDSKARACASKVRGMCAKENLTLPGWISRDAHTDSRAVICKNGMVFIDDAIMDPTTALRPHDMDYFNTFALDFAYDQEADCPTWLRCLDDWFLDDEQTKREIQKMFGYLLVPDNQYEKFFVLTDANGRAGKGTAVQVLTWLLGHGAVGATTFSGFAKDFGLGSLLGKTVGLFNEANAQAQADVPVQAIDRLKSITGNDMVEVERKGVDSVYRQLPLRFVMSCNRMPAFRDPSGALTKRMHLLEFKQSFAGREQTDLKKVGGPLYRELPGILNWAIRGLETLYYEDRAFIRPDAAKEAFEQAERISAPIKAFVSDCLVMVGQAEGFTEKESLYRLFQAWSIHKEGISKPMGREKFFGELRLLCPHRIEQRMRDNRNRSRVWWGVVVSEEGRELIKDGMLEPLDASD